MKISNLFLFYFFLSLHLIFFGICECPFAFNFVLVSSSNPYLVLVFFQTLPLILKYVFIYTTLLFFCCVCVRERFFLFFIILLQQYEKLMREISEDEDLGKFSFSSFHFLYPFRGQLMKKKHQKIAK